MNDTTAEQNVETTAPATMADVAATVKVPDATVAADSGKATEQSQGSNQDDMSTFIASQNQAMAELRSTLDTTSKAVTTLTERESQQILDQAVDKAVTSINDGVNGNADLAEAFLNSQYQKSPDLQKIFDNRDANPDALDRAIGMLKTEWTAMNQRQIDPQVAENQRALQDSQTRSQTPQSQDANARLEKLSDGDFMREMNQLARSN